MSRVSTADIAAVAAPRFGSAVNLRKFWLKGNMLQLSVP